MTSLSTSRSIVVTGANKGIGYEAVKQLSQKLPNATIYLTARSQANGDAAVQRMKQEVSGSDFSNVRILLLEILDSHSIQQAVATVKKECETLDVLLHNSAIMQVDGDFANEQVLNVNVCAAKACIDEFSTIIPKESGKIIVVSSEVGTWTTNTLTKELQNKLLDSQNASWDRVHAWINDWIRFKNGETGVEEPWNPVDNILNSAYGISKALLSAYLRHYALRPNAPNVAIVCPGYCATDLNNNAGDRPASKGGESVIWPIFNRFESGHFYQDGNELLFSSPAPPWVGA